MVTLETNTKYYSISIMRDLFGELLVVCDYGSKLTKFAHRKNIHVASMAEANAVIDRIIRIREKHDYTIIP